MGSSLGKQQNRSNQAVLEQNNKADNYNLNDDNHTRSRNQNMIKIKMYKDQNDILESKWDDNQEKFVLPEKMEFTKVCKETQDQVDETIKRLIELKIIPTKKENPNENKVVLLQNQFKDNNVFKNKIPTSERVIKKQNQLIQNENTEQPQYFGPNHRRRGSQKQKSLIRNNSQNKTNNILNIEKQKENLDQYKLKNQKQLISNSKQPSPLKQYEINQSIFLNDISENNFKRCSSQRILVNI